MPRALGVVKAMRVMTEMMEMTWARLSLFDFDDLHNPGIDRIRKLPFYKKVHTRARP